MTLIHTLISIGFLLSAYASYVEWKSSHNSSYHAACDIGDRASCSKAFASEFGKLFGISNARMGLLFYATIFIAAFFSPLIVFLLAISSFIMSIYLAYILYFKLKNLCIICTILYAVSVVLVVVSYFSWNTTRIIG